MIQLVIGVAVLLVAVIATEIAASQLEKNSEKIRDQKRELSLRTSATANFAELKSNFDLAQPAIAILDQFLPPKDDLINFGRDMVNLGKQHGLSIGFNFGNETSSSASGAGSIIFSISGSGSFNGFQQFLNDIEKSSLFIKVTSFDVTRSAPNDEYNILMNGVVFFK